MPQMLRCTPTNEEPDPENGSFSFNSAYDA